jgi:hypothetical protein
MAQATVFGVHPREFVSGGTLILSSKAYFADPTHDPQPLGNVGSVQAMGGRKVAYLWDGGDYVKPGHLHPLNGSVPAAAPIANESHIDRMLWRYKVGKAQAKVVSNVSPIDPETYRKVRLPRFA